MENNTTLANEEVKELYDSLKDIEENTDEMLISDSDVHNVVMPEKIEVEEDSILYPKNEKIVRIDGSETPEVDAIKPKLSNYEEALKPYGFSDEETKNFLSIISDYNKGVRTGLYERFPKDAQNMIDNLINMSKMQGQKMSRDNAVNIIMDSFINDAKINAAFDEYEEDVTRELSSINIKLNDIIKESIDEIRDIIPKIKEGDPEKAEQLDAILNAFVNAKTFELQSEYLKKCNKKKLKKLTNRLKNECFYFNKNVNSSNFDVRIPDIKRIIPVLRNIFLDRDNEVIEQFVVLICESTVQLDMSKLENVAYVYRMISDLVAYEYNVNAKADEELFRNIERVLDEIEQLK